MNFKAEGIMTHQNTSGNGKKGDEKESSLPNSGGKMRTEAFDVIHAEGDELPRNSESTFKKSALYGESKKAKSIGWGST